MRLKMGDYKKHFSRKNLGIAAIIVITLFAIGLGIGFIVKKYQADKKLSYATKKFELPNYFLARRPLGATYNDMVYLSPTSEKELGYARKCVLCTWTINMLNKDKEIAVEITKKVWTLTAKYTVEEKWKENATTYKIDYSLRGSGLLNNVFLIKNSNGDEIARTDRFLMQLGTTIEVKTPDSARSLLASIERPAFQLATTWDIKVTKENVLPTYLYGAIATITTLWENEN